MQDSTVTITVTAVDGATKVFEGIGDTAVKQANRAANAWIKANDVQNVAVQSTGNLGKAASNAAVQQDKLANATRRSYFAQTALTTVLSAGINQAFLQMVDVVGQAVQRVDLLANFPASMTALGLSAADASESLAKLSKYVGEIGGNLQDATTSVARFAEVTKDVKAATAVFVGLNNAIIAGGGPTQVQQSALEQFIQAYSRGIPQLIEWRALMVAMPAQLNQVAKAMNFTNAQALGEALTNGKVSMQDFVVELTKLSTGTGPIADQALARMQGIQFAFNVFKNKLVEGMTAIIQTIGRQNIIEFFNLLTGVVQQLAVWAVKLISIFFSLFNLISRLFGGPQLKLASDNTAGIADNLQAGAAGAGEMADNLDDASKAAKKTAGSLAAFDKMNVLSDPADSGGSGKDKKPSAAGAELSPADAAALRDIFDGIGGKIKDVSTAAKILAGIIAGLVGVKFAQGLLNQFNGLIKTMEETAKNVDKVAKSFESLGKKMIGVKGDTKSTRDETNNLFKAFGNVATAAANIGGVIVGLLSVAFRNSKLATAARVLFLPLLEAATAVVTAIVGIFAGLSLVTVGIIVAIVAAVGVALFFIIKYWDEIMAALKTAALATKDFLVNIWQITVEAIRSIWDKLYDIFAAPVKWFLNFFEGIFIALVAIVAIFIQLIVGLFVLLVKGIYAVLSAVAGWVYANVITPIVGFFTAMWNGITTLFKVSVDFVLKGIMLPVANWINVNVLQPILGFFRGLWNAVIDITNVFFGNLRNIFGPLVSWIYNNVIVPISNFFRGLWDGIGNGLSGLINGLARLFSGIVGIVKTPLNAMIDLFNVIIRNINKLKVPSWVPNLGGKTPGIQEIPRLARGGIVDQATLSMVGESGKEAIVPLENNLEWLDKLADKINSANGQKNGIPIQLTVQIGEDKVASKIIDLINEKTQMSGRNAIFV